MNSVMTNKRMTVSKQNKRTNIKVGLLLVCLGLPQLVTASDLDIYQHRIAKTAPNMLFLLDNSNSMNAADPNSILDYNPATTYSGPFDSSFDYFGPDGSIPRSPKTKSKVDSKWENRCEASKSALALSGIYSGRMALRNENSDRWTIPKARAEETSNANRLYLECEADEGLHGLNAASDKRWANRKALDDSGKPSLWTTNADTKVHWKNFPSIALFTANYLNYLANPPKNTQTDVLSTSGWKTNSRFNSVTQVIRETLRTVSRPNFGLITYNIIPNSKAVDTGNTQIRIPLRPVSKARELMLSTLTINGEAQEYNPPVSERKHAESWNASNIDSVLDSASGYYAARNTAGWVEIPLTKAMKVVGVVTQGRSPGTPHDQWVTEYRIETRGWDGDTPARTTESYENGKLFQANRDRNTRVSNQVNIQKSVSAVRIIPTRWKEHSSIRVGLLIVENPITGTNSTYIGDSMALALRYLTGKKSYKPTVELLADPNEVATFSADNKVKFKSPIIAECQSNSLVLLTDGSPTRDDQYINRPTVISGLAANCATNDGSCSNEYAALANKPQTVDANGTTITTKPIRSFAIGYGLSRTDALLNRLAVAGGGKLYPAANRQELSNALYEIFSSFETSNYSIATPGSAAAAGSQFKTGVNYIYSTFEPTSRMAWRGNLKKYRRQIVNDEAVIAGYYKKPVVVEGNAINPKSTNFWTAQNDDGSNQTRPNGAFIADGDKILGGGAASRLTDSYVANDRKIYTDINGWGSSRQNLLRSSDPAAIAKMARVISGNSGVDAPKKVVDWILGLDVNDDDLDGKTDDSNHYMGAFIHSRPLVIRVSDEFAGISASVSTADGDSTNQLTVAGSSSGMVHFINGAGKELAAYLPKRHFETAYRHFNPALAAAFAYGWDGQFAALHDDDNNNGTVDSNEYLRLVAGEGRGSNKFTAFNIAGIFQSKVKPLWEFPDLNTKIGQAFDSSIGQSWATPQMVKLKFDGQTRRLVLISGGYSPILDSAIKPVPRGNQVLLLDADTGIPFWWAGKQLSNGLIPNLSIAEMNYPIAADPSPVDVDGDGTMDILFVGDTAGQIFRFDFSNNGVDADGNGFVSPGSSAEIIAQGGLILKDPGASAERKQRSIFQKIAIASNQIEAGVELSLAVVTGHMGDPLSLETTDALMYLRQGDVFQWPERYQALSPGALFDIKNDGVADESKKQRGWIRKFDTGEKGMTAPLIINGKVAVSTFVPPVNNNIKNACGTSIGDNREYFINLDDASSAFSDSRPYHQNTGGGMPIGTEVSIFENPNPNNRADGGTGSSAESCIQATIASHFNAVPQCVGETLNRVYWSKRILPNN